MGILDGIKVIELGVAITGPFCGQILGDHGAEVIKIEEVNDFGRKRTPKYKGISLYHVSMNRNKKSMTLNLKSEEGMKVLYRLVEDADVLITNYSANVPERLGFDYDTLSSINPRIIMTHITGFGLEGPLRDKKAYDPIVQGMGGISNFIGEPDGPPLSMGVYLADHFTALQAAVATSMALYSREITGKGQLIDIAMLDSMVSTHAFNFSDAILNNAKTQRTGTRIAFTFSGNFPTKDGYVTLLPLTNPMWDAFCEVIGREEWKTDRSDYSEMTRRLEDFDMLEAGFIEWASQYTTEEVLKKMDAAGVPCGPVNTIDDIVKSPQTKARDMIIPLNIPEREEIVAAGVPIKFHGTPHDPVVSPPSFLGQHNLEILKEIGYSQQEIEDLISNEVVTQSENELNGKKVDYIS